MLFLGGDDMISEAGSVILSDIVSAAQNVSAELAGLAVVFFVVSLLFLFVKRVRG